MLALEFYKHLKETWGQISALFLSHIFVNFMEKEPGTKICGVLISFREVMNLQNFKFDVVTSYSRIYETFGFLSIFLLIL